MRRTWRCPVCGQSQRLPLDVTFARCGCSRDGAVMKLVEESRSPRIALRAELRSLIDRLIAGEEFPRLVSPLEQTGASNEFPSDGEAKPRQRESRPPRRPNPPQDDRASQPPARQEVRDETPTVTALPTAPASEPTATTATETKTPPVKNTPAPASDSATPSDDNFGAGLSDEA